MKKSQIVSSLIMCGVILLLLTGFTVAWYSWNINKPSLTGINLQAAETGKIKVAVTAGGKDISELADETQYVTVGLEELSNIEDGKFAPGAYGSAVLFVTALSGDVTACQLIPTLQYIQEDTGVIPTATPTADPGIEPTATPTVDPTAEPTATPTVDPTAEPTATPTVDPTAEPTATPVSELQTLLEKHICFFSDQEMTIPVNADDPMEVTLPWDSETDKGTETTVTVYWKWYYEYPFTEDEKNSLTEEQKAQKIETYDLEDTKIGTAIQKLSFQFEITPVF